FLGLQRVRKKGLFKDKLIYTSSAYYLGLFILALALLTPIDSMSDVLAWVHMLQHTLILMVAAPLMALGGPNHIAQWALSSRGWKKIGNAKKVIRWFLNASRFNRPLVAWIIYSITLWVWHIPSFYGSALNNEM